VNIPRLFRYERLVFENIPYGMRLLEIGCGDGDLLIKCKSLYHEVHGVDISESRIMRIQKKLWMETFLLEQKMQMSV
jgi:cyclopropane fatty-acyl-phospholipid synthase-like methyltransferase